MDIILGASFYGCGMALALGGDVLILEQTVVPGSDWALAFDGGSWDATLTLPDAIQFRDELVARQALTADGRACVAAFGPAMAQWCKERSLNIEFSCSIVDYGKDFVECIGVEGRQRYSCSRVIDARPVPFNQCKYLTGLMLLNGVLQPGVHGSFIVNPSSVAGEYYLSLPLPADVEWPVAREAFHHAWDERPPEMQAGLLQLIAVDFAYRNAPNPAAAMEYGYLWGRDVVKR